MLRRKLRAMLVAAFCIAALIPVSRAVGERGGTMDFNFDRADVRTVIKIVSQRTGMRFLVDDEIEGKINISAPRVAVENVFPLFEAILKTIGCAVVDTGQENVYRIVRLPQNDIPDGLVLGPADRLPATGLVTRVIPLRYVPARELAKALQSRIGKAKGKIVAVEATGHLIVTDTANAVMALEKVIAEIDQPGLSRIIEVVPIEFGDAVSMAHELTQAIAGREGLSTSRASQLRRRLPQSAGATSTRTREPAVVASPHSNSLLIVGTAGQIEDLRNVIARLDIESPAGLNAIFLKYLDAEEMAKTLDELLNRPPASGGAGAKTTRNHVGIRASATTAALLVDATPREFQAIRELVTTLDQPPHKVLVEVIIAEVTLSDELNLGFTIAGINSPEKVGDTVVQGSLQLTENTDSLLTSIQSGIFPRGLAIGLAHGVRLDADGTLVVGIPTTVNIDAIRKQGNVKILANTSVEAQNNKQATVSIVENIPLLTSTIQGTGTSREIIQNIERLDVGIKLTLTPHINPNGEIQLELNPSIEAIVDPGPPNAQFAPTIAKREVNTTVTVQNGRTAVISGLIREDSTEIERRIPLLGSIPFLGRIFRHTVTRKHKTNLLILVTPHIISDPVVAQRIEDALREKTGLSTAGVAVDVEARDDEP